MATTPQQQGFATTPAFKIFQRGMIVQTVKRFRGLNSYLPLTQLTPDIASDLLNVVIASSGQLCKMRLPVAQNAAIPGFAAGPFSFWDFQQGNGTRQVLSHFGAQLYWFSPTFNLATLIENNPLNLSPWSFTEANNILFGANGQRMQKWTGAAWQQWGIAAPQNAPNVSASNLPVGAPLGQVINITGSTTTQIPFPGAPVYPNFIFVGGTVTIAGNSNASFNANWVVNGVAHISGTTTGTVFITTPGITDGRSGNGGTIVEPVVPVTGWSWAYAYKNSVTGHVGNISPATGQIIPAVGMGVTLTAIAPTDPQVDTIVWFRTLDGGGDFFREAEVNITTGTIASANLPGMAATSSAINGLFIVLNDNDTTDSALDITTRGPLINNTPPIGTYTALAQGRMFVAGLIGAQSDVVYSGYEQIFLGRPEESFPPNNRIRLSLGAEAVAGIAPMHRGLVIFSSTGKMWSLRGAIEDITLSAPVAFSETLEELPWTLGCLSHYTIQNTPYGLVWLAGDKTVQFWSGQAPPQDISQPVYALLRTITPGTEKLCNAAYFNWLERDWYALTCATGGAMECNTLILFSLEVDTQQIDVFVSNIAADWIGGQSTATLQRRLLISQGGIISELPVKATDTGGLTTDRTTYPLTNGNLRAYWRGGYFGNDQPEQSKLWRWTRIVPDSAVTSYQLQTRYVDDANLIQAPRIVGPVPAQGMRTPMNQRAYRAAVEIDFPEADSPANVLELQVAYIGTSQR